MTDEVLVKQNVHLRRCPFCGGEARLEQVPTAVIDKFVVTCKNRKCCAYYIGYIDEGLYNTQKAAIDAWNIREPIDDIINKLQEENNRLKRLKNGFIALSDHEVCDIENQAYRFAIQTVKESLL